MLLMANQAKMLKLKCIIQAKHWSMYKVEDTTQNKETLILKSM